MSVLQHRIASGIVAAISRIPFTQTLSSSYKKVTRIIRKNLRRKASNHSTSYKNITPTSPPPLHYALNYNEKFIIEKLSCSSEPLQVFRLYSEMVEYQIKKQKVSPSSTSKEFSKRRPQSKPKSSRKKSKEYVRFAPTLFVINEEEESQPVFDRPSNPAGFDRPTISSFRSSSSSDDAFEYHEESHYCVPQGLIQPMARKDLTYTSLSSYPWRKPSLHQTLQEKFQRVKRLTLEPRDLNSFRARLDKAIVMIVLGIFFCFFFTHTLSLTLALMSRASEAREAEKTIDEGMYGEVMDIFEDESEDKAMGGPE